MAGNKAHTCALRELADGTRRSARASGGAGRATSGSATARAGRHWRPLLRKALAHRTVPGRLSASASPPFVAVNGAPLGRRDRDLDASARACRCLRRAFLAALLSLIVKAVPAPLTCRAADLDRCLPFAERSGLAASTSTLRREPALGDRERALDGLTLLARGDLDGRLAAGPCAAWSSRVAGTAWRAAVAVGRGRRGGAVAAARRGRRRRGGRGRRRRAWRVAVAVAVRASRRGRRVAASRSPWSRRRRRGRGRRRRASWRRRAVHCHDRPGHERVRPAHELRTCRAC